MTLTLLVVVVLASYRVTRLVTADYVLDTPRRWVQQHAPENVAYLVGCPWCVSMYVGPAVAAAVIVWPSNRAVLAGAVGLAASAAVGLVAAHLDPAEDFGSTDEDDAPQ